MTTYEFKELLKKKRININQIEDSLNYEIEKMELYFKYSFTEIFNYSEDLKKFNKDLYARGNKIDSSLKQLNDWISNLEKQLDNPEFIINETEFDEKIDNVNNSFQDIFNTEEKNRMVKLLDQYLTLNIKNDVTIVISKVITKNLFLNLLLKTIVFFSTFLFSFWISWKLEYLEGKLGKFIATLIIAWIFYLTVDQVLKYVDQELQYWRVKKMQISYIKLLPIVEKAKLIVNNKYGK